MPFRNVWAVRVREPGDFNRMRTKKITNGVSIITGRLKKPPKGHEGSSVVQAYRFNTSRFKTRSQVTNWLKKNGVTYKRVESPMKINEAVERFRQLLLDNSDRRQ